MARRRENPQHPSIPELPWSLGIVIAGLVYAALRLLLVGYPAGGPFLSLLTTILRANVGLVLLIMGLGAFSGVWKIAWRPAQAHKLDLGVVRALPWPEFKRVCGEAFCLRGYRVQPQEDQRIPYNIDLILRRGKEVILVHCNRWRSLNVGIKEVRELYDTVLANQALRGIFVTSGSFSGAATLFAHGKPLDLIDGDRLTELLWDLRHRIAHRSQRTPAGQPMNSSESPETAATSPCARLSGDPAQWAADLADTPGHPLQPENPDER